MSKPFRFAFGENAVKPRSRKVEHISLLNLGKKITTLRQLEMAALNGKCVVWCRGTIRTPAAFIIGWTGRQLLSAFRIGMRLYIPNKK